MKDLRVSLKEMGFENFLFLGRHKDGRIEAGRYGFKNRSFVDLYTELLRSTDSQKDFVDFCRFALLLFGLIVSAATHQCAFCGAQVIRRAERYFPSCDCQVRSLRRMLREVGVSAEDFLRPPDTH